MIEDVVGRAEEPTPPGLQQRGPQRHPAEHTMSDTSPDPVSGTDDPFLSDDEQRYASLPDDAEGVDDDIALGGTREQSTHRDEPGDRLWVNPDERGHHRCGLARPPRGNAAPPTETAEREGHRCRDVILVRA